MATASAVSTSAPERPPPSPAAACRASRTTTSAPASNSTCPLASKSTRAAPLRSLACVSSPLHPARPGLPPQRRARLAHTPQARTAALQGVVPVATHRAASLLLAQRVLAPDASQDQGNHRIRRVNISTGATTTVAGSGVQGFKDDDVGTNAQFYKPRGITIHSSGTFALVAVRAWPPAPRASWLSPAAAPPPRTHALGPHRRPLRWSPPRHTAPPPACSSLSDRANHRIRRVDISTGATITLAGSGVEGFKDDDVGTNAQFKYPCGVDIDPSGTFALVAVRAWPMHPARRGLPPRSGAALSTLAHTRPRPAPPPSKAWWPPPHTAPPALLLA
eukprot:scaffold91680_cov107-Phaeocystis_antarctica.AAC.1